MSRRFALRYSPFNKAVLTAFGMGPRHSLVEVEDEDVSVRMGWAFAASIPRTSIVRAGPGPGVRLTAGVHGWRGRWLVNGAGDRIVAIQIEPPARAFVCGVPVSLRELRVSMTEPGELVEALGAV